MNISTNGSDMTNLLSGLKYQLAMFYIKLSGIKFFLVENIKLYKPFAEATVSLSNNNCLKFYFHKEQIPFFKHGWRKLLPGYVVAYSVSVEVKESSPELISIFGNGDFVIRFPYWSWINLDNDTVKHVLLTTMFDYIGYRMKQGVRF